MIQLSLSSFSCVDFSFVEREMSFLIALNSCNLYQSEQKSSNSYRVNLLLEFSKIRHIHECQLCNALLQHVLKGKFTILSKPSQHGMRPSWTWPIFVVQSDSHIQRDILSTAIHLTHFYRFCHFGHPCHRSSMLFLLLTHIASAVVQIWAWKSHSYASSKSIGVAFGRNCGCRETFEFRWNSTSSGRHWCTKRCNGWYLHVFTFPQGIFSPPKSHVNTCHFRKSTFLTKCDHFLANFTKS